MATVSELITRFTFEGDLSPQRNFNENLNISIGLLAGFGAAISAAALGLFAFVDSHTQASDALTDVNAETGISVEALQELGFAAEMAGSSSEQMIASLQGLSKVAGDASRNMGRGKKAFDDLGISVKDANGNVKTADVLFGELGDKFRKLGTDSATQKSIIASLGLDASTLQLLNATSEEVDAFVQKARALGIVTTEQAEASAEFQDSLALARFGISAIQQQVAVGLAPAMTDLVNRFVDFLIVNHELIEDGLKYLGQVIISTIGFIERMGPVLLIAGAAFLAARIGIMGFGRALAFAFSPVVLITAAIVAVLLIVDDLITAFNGGQSVIADFFQEFLGIDIVPILHGIVDAFMSMVDGVIALIGTLWDAWKQFTTAIVQLFMGDWQGALDSLEGAFGSLGEALVSIFTGSIEFLSAAFGQMFGQVGTDFVAGVSAWASALFSAFSQIFQAIIQLFDGNWQGALSSLLGAFSSLGESIISIFGGVFSYLSNAMSGVISGIKKAATGMLPEWAQKIIGGGDANDPSVKDVGTTQAPDSKPNWLDVKVPTADIPAAGLAPKAELPASYMMPERENQVDQPVAAAAMMPMTPNAAMAIGGATTNTSVSNTIEQNVEIKIASTEPQQAGAAVGSALQDQLQTAKTQVNRGGR